MSPVWVGGSSIYYWDGLTLATQESGGVQRSISAYFDSGVRAIAVGDASNVPKTHHWDGATWTEESNPVTAGTLNGVHVVSDSEAYAVGYNDVAGVGAIIEWNGAIWSVATLAAVPTSIVITGVFKIPGTDEVGAIGYFDGGATRDTKAFLKISGTWYDFAFLAIATPNDYQFLGMYAPNNTNIWACGSDYPGEVGSIHFYDGTTFALQYAAGGVLNSMRGFDTMNIWAVGEGSAVVHWDGFSWTQQAFPVAGLSLTSIWGHSANNMYIVGYDGTDRYVFQTKDGGTTWITRDDETTGDEYHAVAGVSV
jgi:hypothetical protein